MSSRSTANWLVTTKLTITGQGASEIISQPAPESWIQSPALLATLPSRRAGMTGWRSGQKAAAGVECDTEALHIKQT
jgi:hypothetical protein